MIKLQLDVFPILQQGTAAYHFALMPITHVLSV